MGTKQGLPAWGPAGALPRGVAGGDSQLPRSPNPPTSKAPRPPPRYLLLVHPGRASASRQSWAAPTPRGMVAAGPSRTLRSPARGHASTLTRPRRFWNPRSPSSSQPCSQPLAGTLRPQLRGGGAGGARGGTSATPGSQARWGRGRGRGVRRCSGAGDQGRASPSRRKGRDSRWARPEEGRGLGFVGIKLDPSGYSGPFPLSRTGLDALGDTQRLLTQHRPLEAATLRRRF